MKRMFFAQFILALTSAWFASAARAQGDTDDLDAVLNIRAVGHIQGVTAQFCTGSPEMKFVASDNAIQDTAGGKDLWRTDGAPGETLCFFSREGKPRVLSSSLPRTRATTVFELPGYRPVLTLPGKNSIWATVWKKPLHEVPLLVTPVSEDKGLVEIRDLDSLSKVLEIHDKRLFDDLIGPVRGHEWLAVSQAGTRLVWLAQDGDLVAWDLQKKSTQPVVISRVASCRRSSLRQVLYASPDGVYAGMVESGEGDLRGPERRIDVHVAIANIPDGRTIHIRRSLRGTPSSKAPELFFSPGAREVILLAEGSSITVFDIRSGRQIRAYDASSLWSNMRFALSCDAFALANNNWRSFGLLQDITAHNPSAWLGRHWQSISPDGFYLVPSNRNGLIETASGREVAFAVSGRKSLSPYWFFCDARYLLIRDPPATAVRGRYMSVLDLHNLDDFGESDNRKPPESWLSGLASPDATRGQIAVRRLARVGDSIVPALVRHVRFESIPLRIGKLTRELEADDPFVRENAERELGALGRLSEDELSNLALDSGSLDLRSRAKRLLAAMDSSVERSEILSQLRAIQVLVIIGSESSLDGMLQIRNCAINNRVRAAADLCAGPRKLGARLRCRMEAFNPYPGEDEDGQATESQAV